jgi:Holliday junction resolvase-like predicted endonuclease
MLAGRSGVSQQLVSVMERGQLERVAIGSLRRVCASVEIQLPFAPRWRGGDGARLLDADHALLVNAAVARLQRAGWDTAVEYTFSVYGERGAVDIVAWNGPARAILIVEVKSRIVDTQDTLAVLDRKARLVPRLLAGERGWHASATGVILCLPGFTANRTLVTRHSATFATALPHRAREVRRWIRRPGGRLAAVWFISPTSLGGGTRLDATRRRVRPPRRA